MAVNIQLTDQEKLELLEAVNAGKTPPSHLATKLFPHLHDSFDVKALKNAKIPLLQYEGKRTKAQILASADSITGAGPLQVVREFGEARVDDWRNLIIQGDNLQFLKTCYRNEDPLIKDRVKGKVKLIYIDPPFATKSDFSGNDGEKSYSDKVADSEFIELLRERIYFAKELLSEDGLFYIHMDSKMIHPIKLLLDEIFSKNMFINEIIWHYGTYVGQVKRSFPKKHDTILSYANGPNYSFTPQRDTNPESDANYKRWKSFFNEKLQITGNNYPANDSKFSGYVKRFTEEHGRKPENADDVIITVEGKLVDSVWYIQSVNPMSPERINYPTQKPEELLARIVESSSKKNELIMDLFAGSGTIAAVAEKLGRRWITVDFGKHAIYTMQKRILRIAESKGLGKDATGNYGKEPKAFAIASVGAYDFSKIMKLSEHKDLYINFVLQLFHIARDDTKAQEKFKLANIYALKDNHPVEVYPVWDETYLKHVRIDEEYLQAIVGQSGGKLRGTYYIITPETCTNLSDTTIKNGAGQDVTFVMLKFPYKIFEQVARHAQLQEQPSSTANINDLVTSTAFYFNEDVQISVERANGGLKITHFDSHIFDGDGNRFAGLDGLAMLLIDKNYQPGKPFDMEEAAYAKDIKDGVVKVTDLTNNVAVIAIDKHGNESKPTVVKV